jgi:transcription elongation GreA/GreB family factor
MNQELFQGKKEVIELILQELKTQFESSEMGLKENQHIGSQLDRQIQMLEYRTAAVKSKNTKKRTEIEIGAFITLKEKQTDHRLNALIIGNGLSHKVGNNGNAIWMISINSPLGRAIRGFKEGDCVLIRQNQFIIEDIL